MVSPRGVQSTSNSGTPSMRSTWPAADDVDHETTSPLGNVIAGGFPR